MAAICKLGRGFTSLDFLASSNVVFCYSSPRRLRQSQIEPWTISRDCQKPKPSSTYTPSLKKKKLSFLCRLTYYLVEATLPLCLLELEKKTPDPWSLASWQTFEILNGCWQVHKLKTCSHSCLKFKRVMLYSSLQMFLFSENWKTAGLLALAKYLFVL